MSLILIAALSITSLPPAKTRAAKAELRQFAESCEAAVKLWQDAGADVPEIEFIYDRRGQYVGQGEYGRGLVMQQTGRPTRRVVALNAKDYSWPRWEISAVEVLAHEVGHILGREHEPQDVDSVMRSPIAVRLGWIDRSR